MGGSHTVFVVILILPQITPHLIINTQVVFLVFIIIDLCFLCHLYDNGDASTTSSNAKQHFSHTCIFEFEHEAPGEHKYRTASLRPELDLV